MTAGRDTAAWGLWALGTAAFEVAAWLEKLLRRAGRPDLGGLLSVDTLPLLLASGSAGTVGAVLANRRPRHPVGWLPLGLGLSMVALGAAQNYASCGLPTGAGRLPGDRLMALVSDTGWILWPALVGLVLLLTPTGSTRPSRP